MYLVAGRERRFNRALNRLMTPKKWFIDNSRLVFMEENQDVVYWGVKATSQADDDPPVFQGVNGESIEWYREHRHASVFLVASLYWQAANGGAMKHTEMAGVPKSIVRRLNRYFHFVGEVNGMRAYSRPGEVICFLKWEDPFIPSARGNPWRIFVGTTMKETIDVLAGELGVTWDA